MALSERIGAIYQKYQNKAYIQAEIDIRDLLTQTPNNSDVLRLGALTALALDQVVTAQTRIRQACLYCTLTAEMANTLGNILKASDEWAQSEDAYNKAIALDAEYKPVRANLIDLLVQSGQADRALIEIDSQSREYGETDLMRFARANALINLGRYEEALKSALEINPTYDPEKMASLKVRLFFHLERYDEMRSIAESIPASSNYSAEALEIVVNAYAMQNDWTTCQTIIGEACKKPNAIPDVFVKFSHQLKRMERFKVAEKVRMEGQSRFGENVDIVAENANHLMQKGNYIESVRLYQKALSLRPGDFSIMVSFAQACLAAGQYDMCQNLIQGALEQSPNNQFLFALAATLKRLRGDDYKALYDYENFIRVYDIEPPKGYKTIEEFNGDLKTCLERFHSFQSAPLNQSLRGGIQTDSDLFFIQDQTLKAFFQAIEASILDYMGYIGYEATHPLKRRNTGKYRINGAWSVQLSANGHHVNHVHPMGWISSSYYVDVPSVIDTTERHEGWIKFGKPGIPGLTLEAEKFVKPKSGRLVLFPSYMWHGTVPFSGHQKRLTLPFDVVPA